MLSTFTNEMYAARPYFHTVSPNPTMLFTGRALGWALRIRRARDAYVIANDALKRDPAIGILDHISEVLGGVIAKDITRFIAKPLRTRVTQIHLDIPNRPHHDFWRKNGLGGRSWINHPGRHEMTVVFHDANRAGPHIDVHIGRFSVIYRVKPDLYEQLRYNREGGLTENSRQLILDYIRSEIANGSRVPQNLDHSKTSARTAWTNGDPDAKHYGAGRTRQIVAQDEVDVYKAHFNGPIEMYAPLINPHRGTYIYRLQEVDGSRKAPILIWGVKAAKPPKLEDRLHLKMLDPSVIEDEEMPVTKVDWSTSTAKYDGASAYIVITPDGTKVWSPRISKVTGEQIEYTPKLDGIANVTSPVTIVAMGEVMFRERGPRFQVPWHPRRSTWLSQASSSGLLNSNAVLPSNIVPEIYLYRVDRVGRNNMIDFGFWDNRQAQRTIAQLSPRHLKVVQLMQPEEARERGFEGVVAVPSDIEDAYYSFDGTNPGEPSGYIPHARPISSGIKIKWWSDTADWKVDEVAFEPGERGGLAGVVWLTSLESGKKFKLGPGQVGDRELTEHMMAHPSLYEGAVLRVHSRHGHEGRAAKAVAFHPDKGLAPF